MTALNVIIGKTRAIILTDTACYDNKLVLHSFARKTEAVPRLRLAIATRGDYRLPSALADEIELFYQDMDGLIADEGAEIEKAYLASIETFGAENPFAEIVIVGWSDAKGAPVGICLQLGGERQFDVIEESIVGPLPNGRAMSELQLLGCCPGADYTPDNFDPHMHGLPLITAQRRMRVPVKGTGRSGYIIGGDIHLTTITADGVEQETIRAFEKDDIGDTIKPDAFVPPPIQAGNRQQRRAAERAQRKLTRAA